MDFKQLMQPAKLATFAFYAILLNGLVILLDGISGGVPFFTRIFPGNFTIGTILNGLIYTFGGILVAVSAGYLIYRWWTFGKKLFADNSALDTVAFVLVMLAAINNGFGAFFGINIFLATFMNLIWVLIGFGIVVAATGYLAYRWWKAGKVLFQ